MPRNLQTIETAGSSIKKNTTPDDFEQIELSSVDSGKEQRENDLHRENIENIIADRDLRKKYASHVWWFLVCYLITVIVFLLMSGFSICGFKLHDAVLVTLAGSTAVAAIGLVRIIAKGLFSQSK